MTFLTSPAKRSVEVRHLSDFLSSCSLGLCLEALSGIANRGGRNSKMHYIG
jgi:hypothetical protein